MGTCIQLFFPPKFTDRSTTESHTMSSEALVNVEIKGSLQKVASGKVRDLYAIDDDTLLFVASDRISAYDVIMENVSLSQKTFHEPLFHM
jgi:phosphoribosylaminoimidazole-succinocarboxamide synthase